MGARLGNMDDVVLRREEWPVVKALLEKEVERIELELMDSLDESWRRLLKGKAENVRGILERLRPEQSVDVIHD